jgi:hypothetical protein
LLGIGHIGIALILALGLTAFVVLPLIAHRDLQGPLFMAPHMPFGRRLGDLWHGRYFLRPGIALFVLVGWCFALFRMRRNRPFVLAVILAPIAFLLLGEAFAAIAPTNTFGRQIPNRGLGYAGILAVLPLAALVTWVGERVFERGHGTAGVGLAALLDLLPLGSSRDLARPARPVPAMVEATAQLRALVPDGARYAVQQNLSPLHQFQLTGVDNPERWVAWASGRNTLNYFNVESSSTSRPALTPDSMLDRPPDEAADALVRYGVTHVLLLLVSGTEPMFQSPRFSLVWSSSPMAILAVHPRLGRPSPASLLATAAPATAHLVGTDPEHLRIRIEAQRATEATVAVGWSPKWHARIDGRAVHLDHTAEGLLAVRLPAGESTLALDFRSDGWDRLGLTVSLLTTGGLVLWCLHRRRRSLKGIDSR